MCRKVLSLFIVSLIVVAYVGIVVPVFGQTLSDKVAMELLTQIAKRMEGKKIIAVLDFTDAEGKKTSFSKVFTEQLSASLLMQGGKDVTLVERERIDKILEEQKLAIKGLVNEQTAQEFGQLLGANIIVYGTVSEVGDKVVITAKAVKVETAEIIAISSKTALVPKTTQQEEYKPKEEWQEGYKEPSTTVIVVKEEPKEEVLVFNVEITRLTRKVAITHGQKVYARLLNILKKLERYKEGNPVVFVVAVSTPSEREAFRRHKKHGWAWGVAKQLFEDVDWIRINFPGIYTELRKIRATIVIGE